MDWGSCVTADGVATLACIPTVLNNVIDWALALAGLTAVFFIIFAGFKFLTSGGDPKQLDGARKTLTYAIAGLIIVFLAFAIINLISVITGVTCIKTFGLNTCGNGPSYSCSSTNHGGSCPSGKAADMTQPQVSGPALATPAAILITMEHVLVAKVVNMTQLQASGPANKPITQSYKVNFTNQALL